MSEVQKYSHDQIVNMRRAGLPKPKDITWAQWHAPFELSPSQEKICYMRASGTSIAKIAEEAGMSTTRVSQICNVDPGKFRIKEIQFQMYGKNPQKRFEGLVPKAIDAVADMLGDPNARASTKLSAANTILDRALGRPTQQVEIRSSRINDLYNKMDELFKSKPKDIEVETSSNEDIEEAEIVDPNVTPDPDIDKVDGLFEKQYGESP